MPPDDQPRKRMRPAEGGGRASLSADGAPLFSSTEEEGDQDSKMPPIPIGASDQREEGVKVSTQRCFDWCLRCESVDDVRQQAIVWWFSPARPIPVAIETELEPILVPYQEKERGMFRSQSSHRLRQLQHACRRYNIPITTALSLRRHFIKRYHPNKTMTKLGLGSVGMIDGAARVFEQAVQKQLEELDVEFYSEEDQRRCINQNKRPDLPSPPTPDFVLKKTVRLKTYYMDRRRGKRRMIAERSVNWIEVKMFYGASSIEIDGKSAVGSLLKTARKYVRLHGPGAMLFMQGYGEGLAAILEAEGVSCLDCSGMVDLRAVEAHQRLWCADRQGNILP